MIYHIEFSMELISKDFIPRYEDGLHEALTKDEVLEMYLEDGNVNVYNLIHAHDYVFPVIKQKDKYLNFEANVDISTFKNIVANYYIEPEIHTNSEIVKKDNDCYIHLLVYVVEEELFDKHYNDIKEWAADNWSYVSFEKTEEIEILHPVVISFTCSEEELDKLEKGFQNGDLEGLNIDYVQHFREEEGLGDTLLVILGFAIPLTDLFINVLSYIDDRFTKREIQEEHDKVTRYKNAILEKYKEKVTGDLLMTEGDEIYNNDNERVYYFYEMRAGRKAYLYRVIEKDENNKVDITRQKIQ